MVSIFIYFLMGSLLKELDLNGCWEKINKTNSYINFGGEKITFVIEGKVPSQGKILSYDSETIRYFSYGKIEEIHYKIEKGTLYLKWGNQGKGQFYKKADLPEGFLLSPFKIPEHKALNENEIKLIQDEIKLRVEKDQEVRGNNTDWKLRMEIDNENTGYLKDLISSVGWIDINRFGHETSKGAILIAQHSGDLMFLQGVLPKVKEEFKEGDLYPTMFDRAQLMSGNKQIYGSQIGIDRETGEHYVSPLVDPENVDKRRAKVGLEPLADYIAHWNMTWNLKKHQERAVRLGLKEE